MTDRRRQINPAPAPASRALTVLAKDSANHPRLGNAHRNRTISAFLAHLTLQYDGMAARRVLRSQRLEAAITGYGAENRMRSALRTWPTHDLKI
jgi:hypothetical protein